MAYSLSIENMCQLHDDCMTGMGVRSGLCLGMAES